MFQIERGKGVGSSQEHVATELVRSSDSEQIKLNLALKKKTEDEEKAKRLAPTEFRVPLKRAPSSSGSSYGGSREKGEKRKASALDEIIKEEENRKENAHRKPNWLTEVSSCTYVHAKSEILTNLVTKSGIIYVLTFFLSEYCC